MLSGADPSGQSSELSRNLINSDSGLRLLTGGCGGEGIHQEELLGSQQNVEVEEGGGIMLEAVNPSLIVMGATNEEIVERVSVITSRKRNFK